MRHHKDPSGRQPKQKTTQAQKTPTTPTAATTATSTGTLHPIRGTAPVTWRRTRYVALHPNRRGALLRIGCTAPTHKNKRGTDTPNHSPPHPSMRTWPYWRQDGHAAHATTYTPAHSNTSHTLTCKEPVNLDASGSSQQDFMYGLAQSASTTPRASRKWPSTSSQRHSTTSTRPLGKTLTSLIDQLKDTYIPNPERPLSSLPALSAHGLI